MSRLHVLTPVRGPATVNTSWFPGNLCGVDDQANGFAFTREQAERFFRFWATAAADILAARKSMKTFSGRLKTRLSGQDCVYAQFDGRNIGMIFRTLDSEANLKLRADDNYKIRVDLIILALEVLAEAVQRAKVNEPLGYAEQQADNPLDFIKGQVFRSLAKADADLVRQNRELLAAYGGKWPDKTRTRATAAQLQFLKDIVLNRIDLEDSLKRLETGQLPE